jgi:hypothetical protein
LCRFIRLQIRLLTPPLGSSFGCADALYGLTLMLAMIFVYPMFNNKHINFGFYCRCVDASPCSLERGAIRNDDDVMSHAKFRHLRCSWVDQAMKADWKSFATSSVQLSVTQHAICPIYFTSKLSRGMKVENIAHTRMIRTITPRQLSTEFI